MFAGCLLQPAHAATRLVVWGNNSDGQTNIPVAATNLTGVAVGQRHVAALQADSTVLVWGSNGYGQRGVPAGLSNVVALCAGYYNTLALRSDGTVAAWGDDTYGISTPPAGLTNVAAIAAGPNRSLALQADGTLVGWGFDNGLPSGLAHLVAITHQLLAVRADGAVIQWGFNSGDVTNSVVGPPASLENATAIAAGQAHYMGLNIDGTVIGWGYNYVGQLNFPPALSNVVALAAGNVHTVALISDGTVVAWGDNSAGQCNVPAGLSNVIAVAAGGYTSAALIGDGPPAITLQPFSQAALAGTTVQLHARASGIPPLAFQWQKDGTNVPGATQPSLRLTKVSRLDSGCYRSLVTGAAGETMSTDATLVVRSPQQLGLPQRMPDGSFVVKSDDATGMGVNPPDLVRFEAQTSSNLVHWFTLPSTLSATNGYLLLRDPSATNRAVRFYRILEK